MSIVSQKTDTSLFEIQVSGISCTRCADKIKTNLNTMSNVQKVNVNVLAEKVQILISDKLQLDSIVDKLNELKFKVISGPNEIKLGQNKDSNRTINFEMLNQNNKENQEENTKYISFLQKIHGVINSTVLKQQNLIEIEYTPEVIQGRCIFDQFKTEFGAENVKVFDKYLEIFKSNKKLNSGVSLQQLIISLIIIVIFIVFAMILPQFESFYSVMIYPYSMNIFSLYLIFFILLTLVTIFLYGRSTFMNAWISFYQYRALNMESLITLGCFAAIVMVMYLIISSLVQQGGNQRHLMQAESPMVTIDKTKLDQRRMDINYIVHMLEIIALILAIVNVGKYLEHNAKLTILKMSNDLFPEDEILKNNMVNFFEPKNKKFQVEKYEKYEISLLEKGEMIKLDDSMKLLCDGVIVHIYENEDKDKQFKVVDSICYGQDDPFTPQQGERIRSGAQIVSGEAILQIENTIENCMLSNISNQLNVAQNESESNEEGLSAVFKKISEHFVIGVIIFAFLTLIAWIIVVAAYPMVVEKEFCKWCFPFERMISVLVASCPCALGLAIPSVVAITLNLSMKNQILIKKNNIFDKFNRVGAVAFDKTGTLFTKVDEISQVIDTQNDLAMQDNNFNNNNNQVFTEEELWMALAIIEKDSKHPLGELLFKESMKRINITSQKFILNGKVQLSKTGLSGTIVNKKLSTQFTVHVGNKLHMQNNSIILTETVNKSIVDLQQNGKTSILISFQNSASFIISIDNTNNLRPEAKSVVKYIQNELKLQVFILSGDGVETVYSVGEYLEIPRENLIGDTSAEKKMHFLRKFQQENNKLVMMIGDGLNDILSIQEAGIGVSINAKSELNLIASDVVALNQDLWKIVSLFSLMKYSRLFIILNLIWSFAYNIFIMPVSAGVFYTLGFSISPIIASISMSGSSLVVVLFSNLLRLINYNYQGTNKVEVEDQHYEIINKKNREAAKLSKEKEQAKIKFTNQNLDKTVNRGDSILDVETGVRQGPDLMNTHIDLLKPSKL